jgi:hypothetical protein
MRKLCCYLPKGGSPMKRREFLKGAGALVLASASGAPMMFLGGFGGGASVPIDKIPFEDKDYIANIRKIIAHNGYNFTVERNPVYDETGYPGTPSLPLETDNSSDHYSYSNEEPNLKLDGTTLPSSFDIRNVNGRCYIGPIRNQQDTYMCWAFASCDVASAVYNYKNGLYGENCIELSPMFLSWVQAKGNAPDMAALNFLTKFGNPYEPPPDYHGTCREIDFPFSDYQDHAIANASPPQFLIDHAKSSSLITLRRCGRVFPADYRDTTTYIKMAILKYGAVVAGIANDSASRAYQSGVFENTNTDPNPDPYYRGGGHAISLIGWDDHPPEGGEGCWILRNSFGTSWGEKGYMRIRYFSAKINCAACFIEASPPSGGDDFIISGNVTVNGIAQDGVTLILSGDDDFSATTQTGKYFLQALLPGEYRVTPSYPGATFSPLYRDVTISSGSSYDNIDFAGIKS